MFPPAYMENEGSLAQGQSVGSSSSPLVAEKIMKHEVVSYIKKNNVSCDE